MPQFMVTIVENEAEERKLAPARTKALIEGHAAYEEKLRSASAYVDGERLRPSCEGARVSIHDARPRIDVGPFGDDALSGYYVVEAAGLDEAVELAKGCPVSPDGQLDVRPLMKGAHRPGKTNERGRVF